MSTTMTKAPLWRGKLHALDVTNHNTKITPRHQSELRGVRFNFEYHDIYIDPGLSKAETPTACSRSQDRVLCAI